jgi:hypothetical protein
MEKCSTLLIQKYKLHYHQMFLLLLVIQTLNVIYIYIFLLILLFKIIIICNVHLELTEMLPTIMQQLGVENMMNIQSLAKQFANKNNLADVGDDDVPQLVENFDEASKNETTTLPAETATEAAAVETKSTENTQAK